MLGLILAVLYVAYSMVTTGASAETAFAATLPFLWYWHVTWAVIFGILVGLLFLISFIALFGKKTAGLGALGMFVASPLVLVLGALGSALFLGGVYCVDQAIPMADGTAAPFAEWNIQLFVVGCILYGLACLRQLSARLSLNSGKSD